MKKEGDAFGVVSNTRKRIGTLYQRNFVRKGGCSREVLQEIRKVYVHDNLFVCQFKRVCRGGAAGCFDEYRQIRI